MEPAPYNLPDPTILAVPGFVLLILLEMWLGHRKGTARFETRDTGTSLTMGLGSIISGVVFGFIGLAVYYLAWDYRLINLGWAPWVWIACFIAEDLGYYIFHRTAHRIRWFWASHVVHHSSQHYNLSTALRQSWTSPFSIRFIFRAPLMLLGFHPAMVLFMAGLNLIYQFWIHTELIGRLPRWFEYIFNTPSHHRVHHAVNPRYLDANYAGTLIIWDRLFGTFVPETDEDPPRYGIIRNLATFNPLKVAFHEWISLIRDMARSKNPVQALKYLFLPPGWTPDGSRQTTDMIKKEWNELKEENPQRSSSLSEERPAE